MTNEDKRSMDVEMFRLREHFKQRNEHPPKIPKVMSYLGLNGGDSGPLAYRELCPTLKPDAPTIDNY